MRRSFISYPLFVVSCDYDGDLTPLAPAPRTFSSDHHRMAITRSTTPSDYITSQDIRLPLEVWTHVIELLERTPNPVPDLSSLSLACRDLQCLAQPLVFRKLTLLTTNYPPEPDPERERPLGLVTGAMSPEERNLHLIERAKQYWRIKKREDERSKVLTVTTSQRDERQLHRLRALEQLFRTKYRGWEWPRVVTVQSNLYTKKTLDPRFWTEINIVVLDILRNLAKIEELTLRDMTLPTDIFNAICSKPTLTILRAFVVQVVPLEGPRAHGVYPNIQHLTLDQFLPHIYLCEPLLFKPLSSFPMLQSLHYDRSDNGMCDNAMSELALHDDRLCVFEHLTELVLYEPPKRLEEAFPAFYVFGIRCPNVTKLRVVDWSLRASEGTSTDMLFPAPYDAFPKLQNLTSSFQMARSLLHGRDIRRFVQEGCGDPDSDDISSLPKTLEELSLVGTLDLTTLVNALTSMPDLSTLTLRFRSVEEVSPSDLLRQIFELEGIRSFVIGVLRYKEYTANTLQDTLTRYGISEADSDEMRTSVVEMLPSLQGQLEYVKLEMYGLAWRRSSSGDWREVGVDY